MAGIGALALVLGLPLIGAWTAGRDLMPIFRFPPLLEVPTDYPKFSCFAVALVLTPFLALAMTWGLGRRYRDANGTDSPHLRAVRNRHRFPDWGWAAVAWIVVWWVLAWNRFSWFAPLQRFTFFPLWLGFVVAVNALSFARTGTCLLTRAPRQWLALFATSAVFWWVFEWLNRFAQNWHYLGVADFGPAAYVLNASLCFSTVLPAVTAVAELLAGIAPFQAACAGGPRLWWLNSRPAAIVLAVAGAAALFGTGMAPTRFYAALWAAPLALLVADAVLARRTDLPAEVATGDWRRTGTWALAALVCGFFWELWNVHSAAKWIYTVPYVDRWHVFEMPLLGYTGYLPFGLECYFAATRVVGIDLPFSKASST